MLRTIRVVVEVETMHPNLVGNVWPCVTDVSIHLSHDADVFIAVQERVLFVSYHAIASTMRGFIRFEAGIGQDDDHALGVFVGRSDGNTLLCN